MRLLPLTASIALLLATPLPAVAQPDTALTYQGVITQNGEPVNGTIDLQFTMWDAERGGTLLGQSPVTTPDISDGFVQAELDFGDGAFTGSSRWLEIIVDGNVLVPRQRIGPAPYALFALNSSPTAPTGPAGGDLAGTYPSPFIAPGVVDSARLASDVASLDLVSGGAMFTDGFCVLVDGQVEVSGDMTLGSPVSPSSLEVSGAGQFDGSLDVGDLTVSGNGNVLGNLGVNTGAAQATLHVNGTACKPGGGSWSSCSDGRLKKDVADVTGALERLLELRGVSFEFIDAEAINELSGRQNGMIAQDVEQVFPEWVHEGPDGYKRVTVRGFEALMVEALRDLRGERRAEMACLHDQLNEMQAAFQTELSALEQQIASLRGPETRVGTALLTDGVSWIEPEAEKRQRTAAGDDQREGSVR